MDRKSEAEYWKRRFMQADHDLEHSRAVCTDLRKERDALKKWLAEAETDVANERDIALQYKEELDDIRGDRDTWKDACMAAEGRMARARIALG